MVDFSQWKIIRSATLRAALSVILIGSWLTAQSPIPATPSNPSSSNPARAFDPLNRQTPQSCVYSFLEACHVHDYTRASKYLDIRKLSREQRIQDGPQLAQQLERILDHDPQFDLAALSRDPDGDQRDGLDANRELVDAFNAKNGGARLELERISLHSGASVWLFSADTVAQIPELAVKVSNSPIERYLPPQLVDWKVVDTSLWRWIALAVLLIILVGLSRLLSRLVLAFVVDPLLQRLPHRFNRSWLEVCVAPVQVLLTVALFRTAMVSVAPSALVRV